MIATNNQKKEVELKEKSSLHVQQENFEIESGVCHHVVHNDITKDRLRNSIYLLKQNITAGNKLVIETAPKYEVVEAICNEFLDCPEKIRFKFVIGSNRDDSPSPKINVMEQSKCIIYAHYLGYHIGLHDKDVHDDSTALMVQNIQPYLTY